MSKTLRLAICFIAAFAVIFAPVRQGKKKAAFDGEIFRLHVVANSDSPYDQALKLKVRDVVLAQAAEITVGAKDAEQAEKLLKANEEKLQAAAAKAIASEGASFCTYADFGVFHFPLRRYGSVTLPEGDYNALKIIIGKGEGHNWWCVMYPPLCVLGETAEFEEKSLEGLSEKTKKAITEKPEIKVKWKFAELFGRSGNEKQERKKK